MPRLTPEQLANFARQLYGKLDQLSYYDLLGVSSGTPSSDIRTAFFRMSDDLHPDRYHMMADRELKERLAEKKIPVIYTRTAGAVKIVK